MPKSSTPKGRSAKTAQAKARKTQKASLKKKQSTVAYQVIDTEPRRLQAPKAVWNKPFTWRHRPPVPAYKPLSKARILLTRTLKQLWQHKELFGGIAVLYGLLNMLLVRGIAGSNNLDNLKAVLSLTHGFTGKVITSAGSFVYLLSTSGNGTSATSGIYQAILLLVCSLAVIWALRQTLANHQVRVRDGFYQGMYPLVPFLLMCLLLGVQLLPLLLGGGLYGTVMANGIAAHTWERALWLGLFIVLGLWSLRMITASLFALYVVTLPGMTPLKAYRKAKEIVYGRRLLIWRKVIFLPTVLVLAGFIVELPLIFYATAVAPWVFFVLSMVALPIIHGYLYNLYREML
ncbi:MAG TPA: hypothetical protein VLG92_04770 [Candidatus Saccharimonadia bacterium]|nr:hypothetical protein [Candidatus Saccharimonadia bacterium]